MSTARLNQNETKSRGVAILKELRGRMLPMFEAIAREYDDRTEPDYPIVFDNVESGGYFGINFDPNYGLYIMTDGEQVYAQVNIIGWRNDVRSSASKEKFSGLPFQAVRPVDPSMSDNQLRNLISELLAHWNMQPLVIHITDS